jgi:hypothetical protein
MGVHKRRGTYEVKQSDKRRTLFVAQVEVNRAVSLLNTATMGWDRTLLDPEDFSDTAIDAKILLAIEALEQALVHAPRSNMRKK